jgi:hypothetical protein
MSKKYVVILILFLSIMTVVSGCKKNKNNNSVENSNTQKETKPNIIASSTNNKTATTTEKDTPLKEEIRYLTNGEIDTSDWKIYRNEKYKMEIKYPFFLENVQQNEPTSDSFWLRSQINKKQEMWNKNWDIQFSQTLPDFQKISLKEKIKRFENNKIKNSSFEEIKIQNGLIFYQVDYSMEGYLPGVQIYSKNNILTGAIYIYGKNTDFDEYDQKYIKIFKTILKSIKFDE